VLRHCARCSKAAPCVPICLDVCAVDDSSARRRARPSAQLSLAPPNLHRFGAKHTVTIKQQATGTMQTAGTRIRPRPTFFASLLLAFAYLVSASTEGSVARIFSHGTPYVDLTPAHAKGKRPSRVQWTEPQATVGNATRFAGFDASGTAPIAVKTTSRWFVTLDVNRVQRDVPSPLRLRTCHPRDPPMAVV
jgi:hypothetical protein